VRASAERIESLAHLPTPVAEPIHPQPISAGFTGLVVRELSSSWPGSAKPALSKVNFELNMGQHLYIVGPSGSGKSTLANVLMGFTNYSGSVLVNGVELASVDHDEIRRRIGLLAQQAHIFDTTIEENIVLGRAEITQQSVSEAMRGAQLDGMLSRLPRGAQSKVGAFGSSVSGGEAQRIALARLTVDPRPLVILDEPLEHLDMETAQAVESVLSHQLSRSASITITHHFLSIPDDAAVIELHEGSVVGEGTCREIRNKNGWFQEQWQAQFEIRQLARAQTLG
jgi:ATP-binding cassette subfamily C protein CydCD